MLALWRIHVFREYRNGELIGLSLRETLHLLFWLLMLTVYLLAFYLLIALWAGGVLT